jgi:hypothetical protein
MRNEGKISEVSMRSCVFYLVTKNSLAGYCHPPATYFIFILYIRLLESPLKDCLLYIPSTFNNVFNILFFYT